MRKYLFQMVGVGLVALVCLTISDANAALVGHWTLNGNANDSSGFGNDGTVYGATLVTGHDGLANGAYHFAGSDQILIPTTDSLKVSGDMTVTAWIRAQADGPIVTRYNSNQSRNDWAFNLGYTGDLELQVYRYGVGSEHGRAYHTSNVDMARNDWYHVAAVYHSASSTIQLYVDGTERTAYIGWADLVNSIHASNEPTRIGAAIDQNGGLGAFIGDIDDVRIYNTALTASEVAATVPEPSTFALIVLGGLGLMVFAARKRRGW